MSFNLGNSRIVIYVGVMAKMRQLGLLIDAFSKVKEQGHDVKLLMVGDGTDRENLEKLAGELGLQDDVIFTGQLRQSDVPYFIDVADIGMSPIPPFSFYQVSSPIKTLEYMAMGKPVVASEEILEHREVIEQSGGGILVPLTSEAFANAIIKLLENPKMAREMGEKGRQWIRENRTFATLASQLEQTLVQLVRER